MHTKAFVFLSCVILLMQACGPLLAQTSAPTQPDPPGLLQRLRDSASAVKDKVYDIGGIALGLADTFYEDHIQPVTQSYTNWASNLRTSMWTKIKTTYDSYVS